MKSMSVRSIAAGALAALSAIALLLPACTSEQGQRWQAASLEQAKELATQHHAVVVVDLWKRN